MGLVKSTLYSISTSKLLNSFKKQTIYPYYHIVSDKKTPHINSLYLFKNIKEFIHDIDFLKRHYKALNPSQIFNRSYHENSFLISFDDGLKENYTIIYPILKEKNLKAIFFYKPRLC